MTIHRILAVGFLAFTPLFTIACSSLGTKIPSQPNSTITAASPTFTGTSTSTPTLVNIIADRTQQPTSTSVVNTYSSPTPSPVRLFGYKKNCINIEDALPSDINPGGDLVLYDRNLRRSLVYDFEIKIERQSPFPIYPFGYILDLTTSPDGKWMAYLDYTIDATGYRINSEKLVVQNAEGRKIDMSYWIIDWYWSIGWLDNHHLALKLPNYPGSSIVILNPFTTEWHVFKPDLPDLFSLPEYNANLTYAAYTAQDNTSQANQLNTLRLYDIEKRMILWSTEERYAGFPKWSPDGTHFALDMYTGNDQFKLVSIGNDGEEDTVIAGISRVPWDAFSWSPNGEWLAEWVEVHDNNENSSPIDILMLANPRQHTMTDLCIRQKYSSRGFPESIVWSPDGRFLATYYEHEHNYWEESRIDTIFVDLVQQRAFRFRDNTIPITWMAKP
jgi:hypothetical protein